MRNSLDTTELYQFKARCKEVRKDVLTMARFGRRGHIASAFSMVETLVVLYDYILKVDPKNPQWQNRDRFILSKGHGCMSFYAMLAIKGFFSKDHYQDFCAHDGILGGHPTKEKIPGCEASTGSLGHGLSIGVGIALNGKIENKDYRTFVLLGDGECNEGSIWEAALSARQNRLDHLVVLVDYNKYQSYASTEEVCSMEPFADKWRAFGFTSYEVDMIKDPLKLKSILEKIPTEKGKPTAIICHTIKGQGIKSMEGNLKWHHQSGIKDQVIDDLLKQLEDQA
jgi:transketolase